MASPLFFLLFLNLHLVLGFDDWDDFNMVWSDEFNTLDRNKWEHAISAWGGGNNEFQLYTNEPTNSFVKDGKLFIKPTLLAETRNPQTGQPYGQNFMQFGVLDVNALYGTCTNTDNNGCYRTGAAGNIPPVMSARLRTFQKFSFLHGRVVVRAKMPVGDWLWPAIWMLPEGSVYGGWPRSGEIDLIETLGNRDLRCGSSSRSIDHMGCAMHWGPAWDENHYYLTQRNKDDPVNYGDNFHTFFFDWNRNGLRFYVDNENQPIMTIPNPQIDQNPNPNWNFWDYGKPWKATVNPWASGTQLAPFDQKFYFLLNVAVGGTGGYVPDNCVNRGGTPAYAKPWTNNQGYSSAMQSFYNNRANWQWTWTSEGDNNAMQVDYIRVYQRK